MGASVTGSGSDSGAASSNTKLSGKVKSPKLTWNARHQTEIHLRSVVFNDSGRVSFISLSPEYCPCKIGADWSSY